MLKFFAQQLINGNSLPQTSANDFKHILNIIFTIVGALAFLMVVIGGFRYTIAAGDPNKIAEARRMILYALVGIIVVALAASIVNFILVKV